MSANRIQAPAHRAALVHAPTRRYAEVSGYLNTMNALGAAVINVLVLAALWGQWRSFWTVVAIQVPMLVFNIWVNLRLLPRYGRKAEALRGVIGIASGVLANQAAHWVLPVWLWLPYLAWALDHLERRAATLTLVTFCILQDALALAQGVDWLYPASFTTLAVFCSEISRLRHATIREMLLRSDAHRLEIERSHALLRQANERSLLEIQRRMEAERDLQQAQKLEAIGRLAAGLAHEINTPVQFVSDSVCFLREASADLVRVVEALQAVRTAASRGGKDLAIALENAEKAEQAADLSYLFENIPDAFNLVADGLGRVTTIVRSMKEFAHPAAHEMTSADLNRAIQSTLVIARHEYKYVAELETDLKPLPLVRCHVGDFNQLLLNLIINAAHAIEDAAKGTETKGRIRVQTSCLETDVVISVSDNGAGIPEALRGRVFDPFFTTKDVGRGTGQGLSIARTIVEKHKGQLRFETEVGKGTTFFIQLPIDARGPHDAASAAE